MKMLGHCTTELHSLFLEISHMTTVLIVGRPALFSLEWYKLGYLGFQENSIFVWEQ